MTEQRAGAPSRTELVEWVRDARQRTLDAVAGLTDAQLMGAKLDIVNPLLWEIGHTAWFLEKWVLRHVCGRPPVRAGADALWDSMAIAHDSRWDLPLPTREGTLDYLAQVCETVEECLTRGEPASDLMYHTRYAVHHQDMHVEAFTYTRQTLGYPAPPVSGGGVLDHGGGPCTGDTELPGGAVLLGARDDGRFVFDNEKWAHEVRLEPFAMARAPVTQGEFAAFVGDGGYSRRDLWSDEGWSWRQGEGATHPTHWRAAGPGDWERRVFDRWVPLEPHRPVIHVNWHEANAWCRWAGRRLPTEAEWESAAASAGNGNPARRFPWGEAAPDVTRANLDAVAGGCVDVGACHAGDSGDGCRQLIGNVWEWTSSEFGPYPGFVPDPYREYSEPWFYTRRVLRGGCWATRSRMMWNTWRNFYEPHRRDVFAGFRTCALGR